MLEQEDFLFHFSENTRQFADEYAKEKIKKLVDQYVDDYADLNLAKYWEMEFICTEGNSSLPAEEVERAVMASMSGQIIASLENGCMIDILGIAVHPATFRDIRIKVVLYCNMLEKAKVLHALISNTNIKLIRCERNEDIKNNINAV